AGGDERPGQLREQVNERAGDAGRWRERRVEHQAIAPDHVDAHAALEEHHRVEGATAIFEVTLRRQHYLHSRTARHEVCLFTHSLCRSTLAALCSTSCSRTAHAATH